MAERSYQQGGEVHARLRRGDQQLSPVEGRALEKAHLLLQEREMVSPLPGLPRRRLQEGMGSPLRPGLRDGQDSDAMAWAQNPGGEGVGTECSRRGYRTARECVQCGWR